MNNGKATPLITDTPERAEIKPERKAPEVMIVSWDIHEDELPTQPKEDDKE